MQLEEAISFAFGRDGLGVLNRPEVLASYVRDLCDTDSDPAAANFVRACDAVLLGPFSEATTTGNEAQLALAAKNARNHLVAEYGMKQDKARNLVDALASTILVSLPTSVQAENSIGGVASFAEEPASTRGLSLRNAVAEVLKTLGPAALDDPSRFLTAVRDLADTELAEVRVALGCIDRQVLLSLAEAAGSPSTHSLCEAREAMVGTLVDRYFLDEAKARLIASDMVAGLSYCLDETQKRVHQTESTAVSYASQKDADTHTGAGPSRDNEKQVTSQSQQLSQETHTTTRDNTAHDQKTTRDKGISRRAFLALGASIFLAAGLPVRYISKNNGAISENKSAIKSISAGGRHTVALHQDGTLSAAGDNSHRQCDLTSWVNVTEISAGRSHTVALKETGTVLATGSNSWGQCNISDWFDIIEVSAGFTHTAALCSDGTVLAAGGNKWGQCDVSEWHGVIAVSAGYTHTIALCSDGTVQAAGDNSLGQCKVSRWSDIVAISAGLYHTVALRKDGSVVATGYNKYGQCDVSEWTDIVAISAGGSHTVAMRSDGKVLATGSNSWGQCDVSDWSDAVDVSAGEYHTIVLRSDGTVLATGDNTYRQCDVSRW